MPIEMNVIRSYTNDVCKNFHATRPEKKLLENLVRKNFIYACGSFDGSRDSNQLIREIENEKAIIPGILKKKPGIFWIEEGNSKVIREKIAAFLNEKGLTKLAEDLLGHGKEENKGYLITDDPATQRFLQGLKKHMSDFNFRNRLAKLLMEY